MRTSGGTACGASSATSLDDDPELVAALLEPHYAAVRDTFAEFSPDGGATHLDKVRKTQLLVDPDVHDSYRHFAMCRDDGLYILVAPQIVDLDIDRVVAILCHEFGHASDFLYPAKWMLLNQQLPAVWVADQQEDKRLRKWQRLWRERHHDLVEQTADGIGWAVVDRQIKYDGPCVLQTFSQGGRLRPEGLR